VVNLRLSVGSSRSTSVSGGGFNANENFATVAVLALNTSEPLGSEISISFIASPKAAPLASPPPNSVPKALLIKTLWRVFVNGFPLRRPHVQDPATPH
jgi:hypothetical protein